MRIPRFARTAPEAELRPYAPSAWAQIVIASALLGIVAGVLFALFFPRGAFAEYRYHLWRWEANTVVSSTLELAGAGETEANEQHVLRQYFSYTTQIRGAMNSLEPDTELIRALSNERAAYENDVERVISGYVADAIAEAGLREDLPLFSSVALTWPPVDFELTNPPQILVTSPRDEIVRESDTLLQADLSLQQLDEIEEEASGENQAAIVVSIGGIAAYPAIIRANRNYWSTVETTAHEWVHHYLAFYPLGQQWGRSSDANTLNETTANIAGRELARIVHELHPIDFDEGEDGSEPPADEGQSSDIDFSSVMRQLRLDVDELLEEGKVEEAERLMEETRQELAENGIHIRKINQAYFAFYGTYADTPQSSDPIGPKVERVWELTGDVGLFLRVMRDITNVDELDAALERLEGIAREET